jgi:hypothetical protein
MDTEISAPRPGGRLGRKAALITGVAIGATALAGAGIALAATGIPGPGGMISACVQNSAIKTPFGEYP